MNMREYVLRELESYPRILRQIAVLRYEMEHPAKVSEEEMLDARRLRGESIPAAHRATFLTRLSTSR